MKEEWKKYRDTNYEISSCGRIKNIKTGNMLKPHKKNYDAKENDYLIIKINCGGIRKNKAVHRLVAECFLDNYSESLEVNHKNSIKGDNRVENLEMTTKEENYQYSIKFGNGSQRKPVCAMDLDGNILEFKSLWAGARFIKDKYNKKSEIDAICTNIKHSIKGKTQFAYGYKWEYLQETKLTEKRSR